ncbi:MAG: class I SAM-dependent methyltransferase [Candidatus Bipolaricaulia bacterium]
MRNLFALLYKDVVHTVKKPWRIVGVLNKNKLLQWLNTLLLRSRIGKSWSTYNSEQSFKKRVYSSYEDYLEHQKDKLQRIDLSDYDIRYRYVLRERLEKLNVLWRSKTVLCLAARIGTEVKSFLDIGCFAVGLDINPGKDNRYVLYGDFHDIQFPSHSIDVVFTNSLDHAFDVEKVIDEIKRVLKPEGLLIIEAVRGSEEGKSPSFYESFWWSKVDDLVSLLESSQFRFVKRSPFDYPWDGEQLCFEKEK